MNTIKNYRELLKKVNESIKSGVDTYIFDFCPDYDYDHWYDEDEDGNYFYTCTDLHHIQNILFHEWIAEADAPVIIVFDYYKEMIDDEDWSRVGRLHIFWTNN